LAGKEAKVALASPVHSFRRFSIAPAASHSRKVRLGVQLAARPFE
jgi:hypothetical protein